MLQSYNLQISIFPHLNFHSLALTLSFEFPLSLSLSLSLSVSLSLTLLTFSLTRSLCLNATRTHMHPISHSLGLKFETVIVSLSEKISMILWLTLKQWKWQF